jgi:hypothetical protein
MAHPCLNTYCHRSATEVAMAFVEDMLKGNLITTVAIGAMALVLSKILPDLSPPLRSAVKSGLSLFLESESEAEGGIIERLADMALKNVLTTLSGLGSPEERQKAARGAVEDYKRTAHSRARRYARDHKDRHARRRRHIEALRHRLNRARVQATGRQAQDLESLIGALDEVGQA